jgi:lipopolysaccharide/colanic/teichoic acid biosynthesis glycosyltransferase
VIKRLFDIVASALGLFFLFPLLVLISFWIKFDSAGPVFFRQIRVGKDSVEFQIFKFRTMSVNAEASGRLTVGADKRITRSGAFLRKFKLDELPQLLNVLLGHMSLVGPRPEVPEFMNCYPADIRATVLSVKPGITDLASIHMIDENEILDQYEDPRKAYLEVILPIKQNYYIEYVKKSSFIFDLRIIFATIMKIITRKS